MSKWNPIANIVAWPMKKKLFVPFVEEDVVFLDDPPSFEPNKMGAEAKNV